MDWDAFFAGAALPKQQVFAAYHDRAIPRPVSYTHLDVYKRQMRRILRKIAEGEIENLGDTSTLLDPGVVEEIKNGHI